MAIMKISENFNSLQKTTCISDIMVLKFTVEIFLNPNGQEVEKFYWLERGNMYSSGNYIIKEGLINNQNIQNFINSNGDINDYDPDSLGLSHRNFNSNKVDKKNYMDIEFYSSRTAEKIYNSKTYQARKLKIKQACKTACGNFALCLKSGTESFVCKCSAGYSWNKVKKTCNLDINESIFITKKKINRIGNKIDNYGYVIGNSYSGSNEITLDEKFSIYRVPTNLREGSSFERNFVLI